MAEPYNEDMKKGVVLVIAAIVLSSVSLVAQIQSRISIHLELSKDTLVLGEPAVLTFRYTNVSQEDWYFYSLIYNFTQIPLQDSFRLETPDEKTLCFFSEKNWGINWDNDDIIYMVLKPGMSFSHPCIIWWTEFFDEDDTLEFKDLVPGEYIFYQVGGARCDSVRFAFTEPNDADREFLRWRSSPGIKSYGRFDKWERNLETSYDEAYDADKMLGEMGLFGGRMSSISWYQLDSLKLDKAEYDKKHPDSPFEIFFLIRQLYTIQRFEYIRDSITDTTEKSEYFEHYTDEEIREVMNQIERMNFKTEKDSLIAKLEKIDPYLSVLQFENGNMRWATLREGRSRWD